MTSDPHWRRTPALSTALGAIALLGLLTVLLRRQDLLIVLLPMVVGTVLPLLSRAYQVPSARLRADASTLFEGEATTLTVTVEAAEDVDLVRLQLMAEPWLDLPDGAEHCVAITPGAPNTFARRLVTARWGRADVRLAAITATTAHGLLRADGARDVLTRLTTLPFREGFGATDLVPNAAGIVGAHRSRRLGDGVDLAGVRPFTSGDRLRRINWPVSARTGELHVTATYSERDAEVVLALDTSAEVASTDPASSTLDVAVRAAAAITEHYLRHGDRVGLLNLSRTGQPIRTRAGRAQLTATIEQLLDVRPCAVTEPELSRALSRISDRTLVLVLSPLLSDTVATAVAGLSRAGRTVILIDTLPEQAQLTDPGPWTDLAWKLQLLHRENLIRALAEHGTPVVRWRGTGSLDEVLAGLSRLAVAPKPRR